MNELINAQREFISHCDIHSMYLRMRYCLLCGILYMRKRVVVKKEKEERVMRYEVKAEWMKACGKGDSAKVYNVARVLGSNGHMTAIELDVGNGRVWTVIAEWRGRFEPTCSLHRSSVS